ncbi:hypothetical protein N9D31_03990, partial [Oligoflexaceae bacterium]|nr:hypothetical protein [Oligoflexaceae bacterium]
MKFVVVSIIALSLLGACGGSKKKKDNSCEDDSSCNVDNSAETVVSSSGGPLPKDSPPDSISPQISLSDYDLKFYVGASSKAISFVSDFDVSSCASNKPVPSGLSIGSVDKVCVVEGSVSSALAIESHDISATFAGGE